MIVDPGDPERVKATYVCIQWSLAVLKDTLEKDIRLEELDTNSWQQVLFMLLPLTKGVTCLL